MATNDLSMVRGDTPSFDVDVNNPDGSAYNLTGATLQMTAKRHNDDPDYRTLFTKTSAAPNATIVITDGPNGKARIDMKAEDTADLLPSVLYYDVQAAFPTGIIATPILGHLTILGDATR